jgi:hypothetical protein
MNEAERDAVAALGGYVVKLEEATIIVVPNDRAAERVSTWADEVIVETTCNEDRDAEYEPTWREVFGP